MGIAALFWIESETEHPHGVEIVDRKLTGHEIHLFNSDAVFAGDASPHANTLREDFVAG